MIEDRSQKTEDRRQKTEDRRQITENRLKKTDYRKQMAEVFDLGLRIVRIFSERPITRNP
jgi:hypothetical protein